MPFAVFRRHQRKLLAVFGILAMCAFVLNPSLFEYWSGPRGRNLDPVIVKLHGKSYRQSDLRDMTTRRGNANQFIAELLTQFTRRPMPPFFGDLATRSIVDAVILEHEADALKMPSGPPVAKEWLRELTGGQMTKELFERTLGRFNNRISGTQILDDIASQVRIRNVQRLLGAPLVTPLDIFDSYRDQTERVSARIAEFPVEDFLSRVDDPSESALHACYDQYKNVLPDPGRDTPGFKVPRQVRVEVLSVDSQALARQIKEKLTDAELRAAYENHKADYPVASELPIDLFAKDPRAELTPALVRPFDSVRESVAIALADEKAQAEIAAKFARVRDEEMVPFFDQYHEAKDEIDEAAKDGKATKAALPAFRDLKAVAAKEKLDYELTPLLNRDQAEHYGVIGDAEAGSTRLNGGPKFAAEFFEPKSLLFESREFTSGGGMRFLARKTEDHAPRVPPLKEVRDEVVHAWKVEKARPLAEKAAEDYAAKVKKDGGAIKDERVNGHAVFSTGPIAKMQPSILPGQFFASGPPVPSEVPQVPYTGDAIRNALFNLGEGSVAVAPNQPKTVYYVLTRNAFLPARFATLYAPTGDYFRFKSEAVSTASKQREDEWMNELRAEAGLPSDWAPPDESKRLREEEAE